MVRAHVSKLSSGNTKKPGTRRAFFMPLQERTASAILPSKTIALEKRSYPIRYTCMGGRC
jgi:hypothetical protein